MGLERDTERILAGMDKKAKGLGAGGTVHIRDEDLPKVLLARVDALQKAVLNLARAIEASAKH